MSSLEPSTDFFSGKERETLSPSGGAELCHIGAIDIGTNSTHLLVAAVDPLLHTFSIELAEKSTTRLGERDPDSGSLTELAMARVSETLQRFKDLAESYKVEQLVITATSAVREAPNGRVFLDQIKAQLGLEVDLISGSEEARLIYLGVLSGMSFGENPHVLLDIGGGSTELILADGRDARALTSTRIGAVRLQRDFVRQDPLPSSRLDFLKTFIRGSLEPAVEKIRRRLQPEETPIMVATSGTALALGALIASEADNPPLKLHGYKVSQESLDHLVERLVKLTPEQRCKLTSLSDRRAEIIVPGALILQATMHMLEMDELVLSERALREGLIFDWMMRKGFLKDRFRFQSSIRERTVLHQSHRFAVDLTRAERVAKHSLSLYEGGLGFLHNDKGSGRELLWAAAMLHACGQHINRSSYHKHSWYLIRHGELLGYSHFEHLMVAAIARYHRRSLPKKRHEAWQLLPKREHRRIVSEMAMLLRLATSIDRRPEPVVDSISVKLNRKELIFELQPEKGQNLSLEKWSLMNCSNIVEDILGLDMKVVIN
ncbi:Ppx/GppA phosphatase family protein [Prochlorococcus sp. MIT 1307]|uniref:Ppx/GppA phosphatase family protein n=1 Tax=Prochlorococcus sp. MIT 1307 TaxID=3096219 RepID=UPI002A763828|nr:Ppx/GppA phosphatase family protein [Prochlorococcus sp. MIT 1307]